MKPDVVEVWRDDHWKFRFTLKFPDGSTAEYSTGPSGEGLYVWNSDGIPNQIRGNGQFLISESKDPAKQIRQQWRPVG